MEGMKGRTMGVVGRGVCRTEMAFPLLSGFGLAFVRLAGSSKQAYQWMALISAATEAL